MAAAGSFWKLAALVGIVVSSCVPGIALAGPDRERARPGATCTGTAIKAAWVSFLGAFTAGNYAQLDRLFAAEPEFDWFSANAPGLRRAAAAENRGTLIDYFRRRHARHDRLRLVAFTWNGEGNFTYTLWRSAADYEAGAPFRLIGKGAADCSNGQVRFFIVSLGAPGSDRG